MDKNTKKQKRFNAIIRLVNRLKGRVNQFELVSERFSRMRFLVFILGIVLTFILVRLDYEGVGYSILLLFIALFSVLVYFHRRVVAGIQRHRIWIGIKSSHLARMKHDWEHLNRDIPREKLQPHEVDLNITGERSLHRLIDTTITKGGCERLRQWLLSTCPDLERILIRQDIIRELSPRTLYRDRLRLLAELTFRSSHQHWDGENLLYWLNRHSAQKKLLVYLTLLSFLSALNIILFLLFIALILPAVWALTFMIYILLYLFKSGTVHHLFKEASHIHEALTTFRPIFAFLETASYEKESELCKLCEPFWQPDKSPSHYLRKIEWLAGAAATTQKNEILGIILNAICPWDLYFAWRLDRYKLKIKDQLTVWLDRLYELDALCALGNFAYLNPEYVFPEFMSQESPPSPHVFEAKNLAHPLIPDKEKVSNDFTIRQLGEIYIVTGSNMSGKSTFLRTLGINATLANAGSPVDAAIFQLQSFRLFTCINVNDSLSDGISTFYAEVRRLKELLDELNQEHSFPLFFLVDEIFKGTNNKERQIGSEAYIRTLAGSKGTGVISTHDLELVTLADELPQVHNFHFREEIEHGRMVFDYRLHEGPCPTTNALKIMEVEGLPVNHR